MDSYLNVIWTILVAHKLDVSNYESIWWWTQLEKGGNLELTFDDFVNKFTNFDSTTKNHINYSVNGKLGEYYQWPRYGQDTATIQYTATIRPLHGHDKDTVRLLQLPTGNWWVNGQCGSNWRYARSFEEACEQRQCIINGLLKYTSNVVISRPLSKFYPFVST